MRFHVLSDDLDGADKATLQGIAAGREGTEVCFYEPARVLSAEVLAKIDATLQNRKSLTRASYYRLLAADLLPPDVHRALYLDGDVLCTDSLEELFTLNLSGAVVGMCYGMHLSSIETYNRLGYPPKDGFFNSGVILFDLDTWRKENITRAMLDYLAVNYKKLIWHDNDLICAVLHGRIFAMDFSYNMMPSQFYVFYWIQEEKNNYLAADKQYLPKDKWPALRAAAESPRLVHITSKPWFKDCNAPFANVWRYFYAQSPWANEPLQWRNPPKEKPNVKPSKRKVLDTAKKKIKRLGRKALEAVHLIEKRNPKPAIKPKPKGIPYPEEAYKVAQGILDALREEDGARL